MTRVQVAPPTFRWRFCRKFCDLYASIYGMQAIMVMRISRHHSPHLCSHHVSLPRPFIPDLKLICFTSPFVPSLSGSIWTALKCLHRSWTCTELSRRWHLFVLVSSFLYTFFWLLVLDYAAHTQLFTPVTSNSCIVLYRIISAYGGAKKRLSNSAAWSNNSTYLSSKHDTITVGNSTKILLQCCC